MPVVDPRLAGKPVPKISREAMERGHVARAAQARGADIAFVDQRIPAYKREIINMVGMGVTENSELAPHVKAGAAGFSVTYVRAPQGCGAALHRHATEEVFIPVKGRWQVFGWKATPSRPSISTRVTCATCRSESIAASAISPAAPRRC